MLNVETIVKVRIAHFVDGKGIREICRELDLARNTVRTIIRTGKTDKSYGRILHPDKPWPIRRPRPAILDDPEYQKG